VRRGDPGRHWSAVVVAGLTLLLLRHVQRHQGAAVPLSLLRTALRPLRRHRRVRLPQGRSALETSLSWRRWTRATHCLTLNHPSRCTRRWTLSVINRRRSSVDCWQHLATSVLSAICRRLSLVYCTRQLSIVWYKVPAWSILIFEDETQWRISRARSLQPFQYTIPASDRQTHADRHGPVINTMLA